jgi:hypothetical protein
MRVCDPQCATHWLRIATTLVKGDTAGMLFAGEFGTAIYQNEIRPAMEALRPDFAAGMSIEWQGAKDAEETLCCTYVQLKTMVTDHVDKAFEEFRAARARWRGEHHQMATRLHPRDPVVLAKLLQLDTDALPAGGRRCPFRVDGGHGPSLYTTSWRNDEVANNRRHERDILRSDEATSAYDRHFNTMRRQMTRAEVATEFRRVVGSVLEDMEASVAAPWQIQPDHFGDVQAAVRVVATLLSGQSAV